MRRPGDAVVDMAPANLDDPAADAPRRGRVAHADIELLANLVPRQAHLKGTAAATSIHESPAGVKGVEL